MTGSVARRAMVMPGMKLAGRYLLAERYSECDEAGESTWWARDELLSRLVWVRLLPSTGPFPAVVLGAARAAAGLTDRRFSRVLDVGSSDGLRYLISEAVAAPSLSDLLADAPLAPAEAVSLVTSVAEGIAAAHAGGLAHGRLSPDDVFVDDASIKILGLDGASLLDQPMSPPGAGEGFAGQANADVQACGALLYAALTGHWPGSGGTAGCRLPAAPRCGGIPCRPAQLRAGIPACVDRIVCVLLGLPGAGRPAPAAPSAVELVSALRTIADAIARDRHPPPDPQAPVRHRFGRRQLLAATAHWPLPGLRRAAGAAAVSLLLVGLLLAGGQLGLVLLADPPSRPPTPAARTRSAPAAKPLLPVHRISVISPGNVLHAGVGVTPVGEGGATPAGAAALAVDGDPTTAWRSGLYPSRFPAGDPSAAWSPTAPPRSPIPARPGSPVGLVLDLGKPQTVATVNLVLLGRLSDVRLRAGLRPFADPAHYPLVRQVDNVGPRITLVPDAPLTVRYLLIELTGLPAGSESPGLYRGGIAEIAIRG